MNPKVKFLTVCFTAVSVSGLILNPKIVRAAGDLTKQQAIEITVQLGNDKNELRFFPNTINIETGKLYKMRLINPSPQKHYFSSDKFARGVFTRKVQTYGSAGQSISEVKGFIREIEVYPKGVSEWWFVPITAGEWNDLKCTIKDHAKGGMVGTIISR